MTSKYGRVVSYQGLKKIEKFISPKCSRSLTRGLDYSDLNGRNLVFWKSDRLGEVVVHGDGLYLFLVSNFFFLGGGR